jgi:hypothetical protein
MHVHGLVSGQIWIDMVGDVAVFAHATGEKAKLRLAKASGKGGSGKARRGRVEGEVRSTHWSPYDGVGVVNAIP